MRRLVPWLRALAALALVSLAGCSSTEPPDATLGWTPERLYAEARDELASGNREAAIKLLEKLEARYPFGHWAEQAQLDIAWAHFKDNERALSLAAIDRFMKLHPNHAALDYALYLKGLVNFNEQQGLMARFGGQDLSERDQAALRESFDAFKELVKRFPDSRYAPDAEARMRYLVNSMARGKVHIARYYYSRGAYVAAANRAQEVIRDYQEAPALEEALYLLIRSYEKLGLDDLRADAERVMRRSFPDSQLLRSGLPQDDRRWWQLWR
ncbi:MAG: outer membrane protein assembly factor BamD [Lautropia sp.]|nr:MAG: outer membrane protein assembly factor BamD [Pseudomonadota bacterium]MBC6958400.1 outer membrane protein assembly factor BamD [Lautropia sp.]MCL4702695.1 outer membrane protein assembly factor BamD [Burkholderiaceae bacterium]MCZ2414969.1 outer membrane protein assembly factor BamD [Burkholderiales bacterium]MDL1907004.1 outer membrane protein assembly factor BamD [Betaproteobacteria bacterium PRO1]